MSGNGLNASCPRPLHGVTLDAFNFRDRLLILGPPPIITKDLLPRMGVSLPSRFMSFGRINVTFSSLWTDSLPLHSGLFLLRLFGALHLARLRCFSSFSLRCVLLD